MVVAQEKKVQCSRTIIIFRQAGRDCFVCGNTGAKAGRGGTAPSSSSIIHHQSCQPKRPKDHQDGVGPSLECCGEAAPICWSPFVSAVIHASASSLVLSLSPVAAGANINTRRSSAQKSRVSHLLYSAVSTVLSPACTAYAPPRPTNVPLARDGCRASRHEAVVTDCSAPMA